MAEKIIQYSVRVTPKQFAAWNAIAEQMHVSRNAALGVILDSVRTVTPPSAVVVIPGEGGEEETDE